MQRLQPLNIMEINLFLGFICSMYLKRPAQGSNPWRNPLRVLSEAIALLGAIRHGEDTPAMANLVRGRFFTIIANRPFLDAFRKRFFEAFDAQAAQQAEGH